MKTREALPGIRDVEDLEERLSRPQAATIEALAAAPGDLLFVGAGGKMGPTLARMARRAVESLGDGRQVIAASRFTDTAARRRLESFGVETLAGDLLDPKFVTSLPECPNVIYMVGQKFGTSSSPGATWVVNAYLPGVVCQRFLRSRIVSFSTGNVYGMTSPASGGSREEDALAPIGEYAMSAVARERVFDYFCRSLGIPLAIVRLNYAVEMRYGVLVDLAKQIERGEPISLATGHFNCIWQGDANDMTLRSLPLASTPPRVLNLTGPEVANSSDVCERLAKLQGKEVRFRDEPAPTALLSNARATFAALGAPTVDLDELIDWTADWVGRGAHTWDRPTHFEVRDGKF